MTLRCNQNNAIQISVENNFESGVHSHATGTGKSWIALELLLEYNKRNKSDNIIWLCEQKSILIEQFNRENLKTRGYDHIFNIFLVINYTETKNSKWYECVNSSSHWNKPLLLIINRSFLVSQKKYTKLSLDFGLIIHDECHSIINKTTKLFYEYILNRNKNISCLGFSATPHLQIAPYTKILSHYSIYDAYKDGVILKPCIKWVKCEKNLTDLEIIKICKREMNALYYKKIIIWCGIIDHCTSLANLWREHFQDFIICIDTSIHDSEENNYETFKNVERNAILFCACKHREGSDIYHLDACIFLDKVSNRNAKTFVQCVGRVLRLDNEKNKKYGLILDLYASSCLKLCDRLRPFLGDCSNFPWKYNFDIIYLNHKKIILNELQITDEKFHSRFNLQDHSIKDVTNHFIKPCPNDEIYIERLYKELEIINKKKLNSYLIRAIQILQLTDYIPHVTRGSCGSSLVCYLLGISNVDPIQYNICFERFLNEYRENLPDIDLDFPHYLRDEVFLKLELTWPNQVARISNHVHWHEKSALREALRKVGIHKQVPKEEIDNFVKKLPFIQRQKVKQYQKELENSFRHYSLHCGGIVFFHDGIPEDIILKSKETTISQIIYDKNDVAKEKNFKIDILSSRGISQLLDIRHNTINFADCPFDKKLYSLLQQGNNIGITLAESPLMRKALLKIKPKSLSDIAICLAIIRPAAKDSRIQYNTIDFSTAFVFDDDAIELLSNYLNISYDLADLFRRCLSKGSWGKYGDLKNKYEMLCNKLNIVKKNKIKKMVSNLRQYSFCKSHAFSYAQLVYHLAYEKAYNPKKFWVATLKNNQSAYRKWVHLYEAKLAGVDVMEFLSNKHKSIYAEKKDVKDRSLSKIEQLKKYGYWLMYDTSFIPNTYFYQKENNYLFNGIIASSRLLIQDKKKILIASICVMPRVYIEVMGKNIFIPVGSIGIKGRARIMDFSQKTYEIIFAKTY